MTEQEIYDRWTQKQPLGMTRLSEGLYVMHGFHAFGPIIAGKFLASKVASSNINPYASYAQNGMACSQELYEARMDEALKPIKDAVVLATTPTWLGNYQTACLLKKRGFELVHGKCYKNPSYCGGNYDKLDMHPGNKDGFGHWVHVWWKEIGEPKKLGEPAAVGAHAAKSFFTGSCGCLGYKTLDSLKMHTETTNHKHLCLGWLKRGELFPKGWRRFYSAEDAKLGADFDNKATVQPCPHVFDLKIFEGWKPDYATYIGKLY